VRSLLPGRIKERIKLRASNLSLYLQRKTSGMSQRRMKLYSFLCLSGFALVGMGLIVWTENDGLRVDPILTPAMITGDRSGRAGVDSAVETIDQEIMKRR
jgi:hypothetical protein